MRKLLYLTLVLVLASCVREETFDNTPRGNFQALWTIMDEHYCYFDYKYSEYGLDWDDVYRRYFKCIIPEMSEDALFEVLCRMLGELRDGHVNLYSAGDIGRNWSWEENFPKNFSEDIVDSYLGTDYKIAGGMHYRVLEDNIGYVRYEDFTANCSDGALNEMLSTFLLCNGLIIDVRGNGGGVLDYESRFASRFTNERVHVGYISHKTGPGHSDFSKPEERWIEPAMEQLRWQKPVAVLTNRGCYSATNTFVSDMKYMPQVRVFGDRTGGGGGVPLNNEIPNGWVVRYSGSPMTDASGQHIEFGVEPDVHVDMTAEDMASGIDTIIEAARKWINSQVR